jgi:hypothetical protein
MQRELSRLQKMWLLSRGGRNMSDVLYDNEIKRFVITMYSPFNKNCFVKIPYDKDVVYDLSNTFINESGKYFP